MCLNGASDLKKTHHLWEEWIHAENEYSAVHLRLSHHHSFFKKRWFSAALHCCAQALPSCGEQGPLSSCGASGSHCRGFSYTAWALERGLQ